MIGQGVSTQMCMIPLCAQPAKVQESAHVSQEGQDLSPTLTPTPISQ